MKSKWMSRKKELLFLGIIALMTILLAFPALAGWEQGKKGNRVWYTDETGERVTGLVQINGGTYYFNAAGILQTKWVATEDGFRYFDTEGKVGKRYGRMLAGGVRKIGKKLYGFDENGIVLTGLKQIGNFYFYFNESEQLGVRGRALMNRFVDLPDGRTVFFQKNGRMAFGKWVRNKKFYIDADGNLLRNAVTPNGYLVDENGKKVRKLSVGFFQLDGETYFYRNNHILKDRVFKYKKNWYYVDENGIRQTGWVTWNGHDYYFRANGRAATGTVKIGGTSYTFSSNGQLETEGSESYSTGTKASTGKASILILCGHGQGDSGAVGKNKSGTFYEYQKTREFGRLIYSALRESSEVNAYLFNTNYDMYQQMKNTLGSIKYGKGTLQSAITGKGKLKDKTYSGVRKNTLIPDPYMYDYVLEVHFNATGNASKDPNGNGTKKGTGTYVNVNKSNSMRSIDRQIIKALNGIGLNTWGSGVYGSDGLLNARVYQEMGVNYSLLETCFIDDNDDMKFYKNNKEDMAKAVAGAIIAHFR